MSLMVVNGSEMIRYNPSANAIEASNTRGFSWSMRHRQVASVGLNENNLKGVEIGRILRILC